MKLHFVSSFSKKLWDEYAEGCIRSQVRNLPDGCTITYYIDGEFPKDLPNDPRVTYKMLEQVFDWVQFEKNYKFHPKPEGLAPNEEFRFKFLPFAKKVFSLWDAFDDWCLFERQPNKTGNQAYLCWIDADVYVRVKLSNEWFLNLTDGLKANVVCLLRGKEWGHGDTGFLMLKDTSVVFNFLQTLKMIYESGFLFDMKEWHDAFVFSALLKLQDTSLFVKNLNTKPNTLHPFEHSPLHPFLTHYKGPQKRAVAEGKLDEGMKT